MKSANKARFKDYRTIEVWVSIANL
jgi:hypothetical protein